jgi:hypothetical protein
MGLAVQATAALIPCHPDAHPAVHQVAPAAKTEFEVFISKLQTGNSRRLLLLRIQWPMNHPVWKLIDVVRLDREVLG